jgi:hypothetical protein
MESGPDRDEALARLTEDVCTDGFTDLALVVIDHVEAHELREAIAIQCSLFLEKVDDPRLAARMSAMMRNRGELRTAAKDSSKLRPH